MNYIEKIKNIGDYFRSSNVIEGSICIVVEFPNNWLMPDEKVLKETYNIELVINDGFFYFMTEIENGEDCLFSAIEDIIQSNRDLEAKLELLDKKVAELREIFAEEPLEKLQTLTFTFDKKVKPIKKKTKIETASEPKDNITSNVAEIIKNRRIKKATETVTQTKPSVEVTIQPQKQQVKPKITEQDQPSSLVNFAMTMANN